ncbi:MAG TPA: hypothetical protein VLT91_00045 [Rhizomicrobium sp.]|nr:hypothetical protein [Rhizomicrobium sp.]
MSKSAPFEHVFDLSDLSAAGAEVTIDLKQEQRAKLAAWLDVESVEKFTGVVALRKLAMNRFRYEARLLCDLTQPSVVTLEPLQTHIAESFSRELHVAHRLRREVAGDEELALAAGDDDAPEEIESSKFDLAGPLLEELSLALDPYPRAPGEAFRPPELPDDKPESPFAVLKRLKGEG